MKTSIPHYYHCATKGFDHSVLFADTREFIAGMNRIGICLATLQETAKIIVIAFCLMDNHIHFILYGTREDCNRWMSLYHRLTMIWQKKHRNSDSVDELWEYDAWQIMDQEDLKEKIAYVFRNPTVARMGVVPGGYRWNMPRPSLEPISLTDWISHPSSNYAKKSRRRQVPTSSKWLVSSDFRLPNSRRSLANETGSAL